MPRLRTPQVSAGNLPNYCRLILSEPRQHRKKMTQMRKRKKNQHGLEWSGKHLEESYGRGEPGNDKEMR